MPLPRNAAHHKEKEKDKKKAADLPLHTADGKENIGPVQQAVFLAYKPAVTDLL
jgi:hypothetical protein